MASGWKDALLRFRAAVAFGTFVRLPRRGDKMKTVSLGIEDFGRMRASNYFYIDKTAFIREWWEKAALVTVLTRPRRFGKSLMIH